jgi:hypothetical protein
VEGLTRLLLSSLTLALLALQLGCLNMVIPAHQPSSRPATVQPAHIPSDVFSTLKNPTEAHAELCTADATHPNFPDDADVLTKTFCQDVKPGGVMPTPHSLADLLVQLGLDFKDPNGENGVGGNPGFALLGHSSALTARKVSSMTPTAFVFTPPPADGSKPPAFVFLAFDPGETFVEVASNDPTNDAVNLYIVLFDKACTHAAGGCKNKDLLTQNLTTGWSNVRAYESSTLLNNTIADCRECHASPTNDAPLMLRMQEIQPPFTHWFSANTEGGKALYADFHKARGAAEDYGPIPAALVDKADPSLMATMITQAGFGDQPNAFPSAAIEAELKASSKMQPWVNTPPGRSATWQALFDGATAGQFIATPYHDVKVTDPDKLTQMSRAYQDWRAGKIADIPDIRDVFLDDGLREMGFAPREKLDGQGLLVQMCQQCHNANLDMMITREKFLVDQLDMMPRAEKDEAIKRLNDGADSRLLMPPTLFRTITDDERNLMIAELQK